jgi:hypothetical protein
LVIRILDSVPAKTPALQVVLCCGQPPLKLAHAVLGGVGIRIGAGRLSLFLFAVTA